MRKETHAVGGFLALIVGALTYTSTSQNTNTAGTTLHTAQFAQTTVQGHLITPVNYAQFCANPKPYLPTHIVVNRESNNLEIEISREELRKTTLFSRKQYMKTTVAVIITTACDHDMTMERIVERKYRNGELMWETPRHAEKYGGENALNTRLQEEIRNAFSRKYAMTHRN